MILKSRLFLRRAWPGSTRHFSTTLKTKVKEETGVHKIETKHTNPMKLFQEWYEEHIHGNPNLPIYKVFCFSTASNTGDISSRSLILRRLDEDGFVILTDNRSYKTKNLEENPRASMVFLWNKDISNRSFTRQIRVGGSVKQLPIEDTLQIYSKEPLFAKIRSFICHQGRPVEWNTLKREHDEMQEKLENNEDFKKPEHIVTYKIIPEYLDFYEVLGTKIADRLLFTKTDSAWTCTRIAA